MGRQRLAALVALLALACALPAAYVMRSSAAPVVPLPSPVVWVKTQSGKVVRETPVPVGGVPVPIDVDNGRVSGLLQPDIDVSVPVVALEELGRGRIVVPQLVVRRHFLAPIRRAQAPALRLDARIEVRDVAAGLGELATITYGFETPPGGRVPPVVRTKLTGPLESGFSDPFEATIEAPGYDGPLKLRANVRTPDMSLDLGLRFDPLPERLHFVEDPRRGGFDFRYDHAGDNPDVKLDAAFDLTDRRGGGRLRADAVVERLPGRFDFATASGEGETRFEYAHRSAAAKPDVEAAYRSTRRDGTVVLDGNVRVAGLPSRLEGVVEQALDGRGGADVTGFELRVADGERVDAVDFVTRNFTGDPGLLPEPVLGPDQFVAQATRRMPDGRVRYRLAGRLEELRGIRYEKLGGEGFDIDADVGDGVRPLRAIVDSDGRGAGAPDGARRLRVDTRVTPLPRRLRARYEPSADQEPTRVLYEASQPADVDADALLAEGQRDGCGDAGVTCAEARIDKLPPRLKLELPGLAGRDLSVSHEGTATSRPDLRAELDRTPLDQPADRAYAEAELLRVPNEVRGRLDTRGETLGAAEFHACDWDYDAEACRDEQGALGRVAFTVRDRPERAGLPPRPDTAPGFVTFLQRDGRFEAAGRMDEVRNLTFRHRDDDPGDDVYGTLGTRVDAGAGGGFDTKVDRVVGEESARVDVAVAALPASFSACLRPPRDSAPPDPDDLDPDSLLADCDRTDVLDRADGALDTTPLSSTYGASAATRVATDTAFEAPDPDDAGRPATQEYDATIDRLPQRLRADVILPEPLEDGGRRELEVDYRASDPIERIDLAVAQRRSSSICEDPRPDRSAVCLDATIREMPSDVRLSYAPGASDGALDVRSGSPPDGGQRPSIDPFRLSLVEPAEDGARLILSGHIRELPDHLTGSLQQADVNGDGEPEIGMLAFDGCPDAPCDGVGEIAFTATNALVGDPVPPVPDAGEAGLTQELSYMQRGTDFRATGRITNLKEVAYSRLEHDSSEPSKTTTLRAAFGNGSPADKLRAYVDVDDGSEALLVDGVVREAPQAVELCTRDAVGAGEVKPDEDRYTFCERAPAGKAAVQTRLDTPATGERPDVELRRLEHRSGGGTKVLTGSATVDDLAERIDVLIGGGEEADLLVEGHGLDDGEGSAPRNAAGRVSLDFRNFRGTGGTSFPSERSKDLTGAVFDPPVDTRNDDLPGVPNRGRNYLMATDDDGALRIRGSVPAVRRVRIHPELCEANADDARYPEPADFPEAKRPSYTCVNAQIAGRRPLGFALRRLEADGEVLALEEGHLDSVPAGEGGLSLMIANAPGMADDTPVCSWQVGPPCRPPLLSVTAPKEGDQTSVLDARFAAGGRELLTALGAAKPLDPVSKRLDYEASPRDYLFDGVPHGGASPFVGAERGGRIKIGTRAAAAGSGTNAGVRGGLKLALPRYLDLDPPTLYSCTRSPSVPNRCNAPGVGPTKNKGQRATDVGLKLIGANAARGWVDGPPLGRIAIFVRDLTRTTDVVVTGARDDNLDAQGRSPHGPENPPPVGKWDRGFELPGYTDLRVYLRDDYNAPSVSAQRQSFAQLDGRVNRPLTAAVRMNEDPLGNLRTGGSAASSQLTIRNAPAALIGGEPGAGGGSGDILEPSFRLRSEVLLPQHNQHRPPWRCGGGFGFDQEWHGFGASLCLLLPKPKTRWWDVQLNADPDGPGGEPPAALMEMATDIAENVNNFSPQTNIHMEAFDRVDSKSRNAKWTQQVGIRLEPMDYGIRAGAGIGIVGGKLDLLFQQDLIQWIEGVGNEFTRFSQWAGRYEFASLGGKGRMTTDQLARLKGVLTLKAVFGLLSHDIKASSPWFPYPAAFRDCSKGALWGPGSNADVTDGALTLAMATLAPTPIQAILPGKLGGKSSFIIDAVLPAIWCLAIPMTNFDAMIDAENPAPPFEEPDRPVPGIGPAPSLPPPPPALPPAPEHDTPPDITIDTPTTLCGDLGARELRVTASGRVDVGDEGESVTLPDGQAVECDGWLAVSAERVTIDAGAEIDAGGARTSDAGGTPDSGQGGGAGHAGAGGAAGDGSAGGGSYPVPGDGPVADFGSPGRDGSGGAGGRGGGTVFLAAERAIRIDGRVSADGGGGSGGGGGGSGGAIELAANKVVVTGTVRARGGDGDGGASGGGGSGGRIGISGVVTETSGASLVADGGDGGPGAGAGEPGDPDLGSTLGRAAGVTRDVDDSLAWVRDPSVELKLSGVQAGGGPLRIVVCRRAAAPGDPDGLQSAALDPPGTTVAELLDGTCVSERFDDATANGNEYERTISLPLAQDGYHGFYALAASPPDAGDDCLTPGSGCEYQPLLPAAPTALVARDSTPPRIDALQALNGLPGCPGPSLCRPDPSAELELRTSDALSGLDLVRCQAGSAVTEPCGPGERVVVELGDGDGLYQVRVEVRDRAGNAAVSHVPDFFFVDRARPHAPEVTLDAAGPSTNGWFRQKPRLSVAAVDPALSGGFADDPIRLEVDGADLACGVSAPAADGAERATCSHPDTEPLVPGDGQHVFRATAVDRTGNISDVSEPRSMRVDTSAPNSRLFLGPREPDGRAGWYRTPPFFAFAASDTPGGSGVDPGRAPSAIRYRLDGGPYRDWDPADDAGNRIPDGVHELCWFAIDVAGNAEAERCRAGIEVDSTSPEAEAPIDPQAPDGRDSFYTGRPEVDPAGSDAAPGSGLDRVEYQLDGGAWRPAEPVRMPEGVHELRVRAFDVAGNPSQLSERVVRVDATAPVGRLSPYPPVPNGRGWYRRPVLESIATSDGSDGSGEDGATYTIDGARPLSYLGPFAVGEGSHRVTARARDLAGLVGDPFDHELRVDQAPPVVRPLTPAPRPILLAGATTLRFRATDARSGRVKVRIQIYDTLGNLVRELQAPAPPPRGAAADGFRALGAGSVSWNGRDARGRGVLPGLHYYRVQATDEAGNTAISTESAPFLVLLGLFPR